MLRPNLAILASTAAILSACTSPPPPHYPVVGQYPYAIPQHKPDPIRETSQQLSFIDQIMRQIQSIQGTTQRF
jgi:hypothetical protein